MNARNGAQHYTNDWASDFSLVWKEVPGAKRLCERLNEAETKGKMHKKDISGVSGKVCEWVVPSYPVSA
jgi:hypothetical protein